MSGENYDVVHHQQQSTTCDTFSQTAMIVGNCFTVVEQTMIFFVDSSLYKVKISLKTTSQKIHFKLDMTSQKKIEMAKL